MTDDPLLREVLNLVPADLRNVSGSLLASGRDAWTGSSPIYLVGLNPGGDPESTTESVVTQASNVLLRLPANYSAYRDEEWASPSGKMRPKGTAPFQRRVLHLLRTLDLDPGTVPASNLIFARTRRWQDLPPRERDSWAAACWPFHQTMIERLGVRVVVCLGGDAAGLARIQLGAHDLVDEFVEINGRRWTSQTFLAPSGIRVVSLTHPSIADWCAEATDPTRLVVDAVAASA